MATRQSFNFTAKAKPKYGVDQRRSSQFRVEERTELSLPKSGFLYPILLEIPLINLLLVVHQYHSMMSFVGWSVGFSRNVVCLLFTGFFPKRHLFVVYRFFPKTSLFECSRRFVHYIIKNVTLQRSAAPPVLWAEGNSAYVRAEWSSVHVQHAVHACFLLLEAWTLFV